MNLGQEIVVPVKKDQHNFLNAFFLAKNGGLLLTEVGAKTGDTFNEFTGDGFLKPDGAIIKHTEQNSYQAFIHTNEAEYDQTNQDYKRNDKIIFEFCREYTKKTDEDYFFLIRGKGETRFRFPEIPTGVVFIPNSVEKVYIVFLEFEEVDGTRYYNLVAETITKSRGDSYCSKYLIKKDASVREGCSLKEMSKQQPVVDAVDAKINEVNLGTNIQGDQKNNRIERLTAFKNTVIPGLNPRQREQANVAIDLNEAVGTETSTALSETVSSYTPSVNERVNNMFAYLPSFTQTLVPGENVCADKMIIEMLKTNTKRPSLFSGGRRYKKTTQRRHDSLHKRNKTKRRVYKNV